MDNIVCRSRSVHVAASCCACALMPAAVRLLCNVGSDKCMRAAGDNEGSNVQQGRCVYRRSKWTVTEVATDIVEVKSLKTGNCAEVTSTDAEPGPWLLALTTYLAA